MRAGPGNWVDKKATPLRNDKVYLYSSIKHPGWTARS